MSDSEVLFIKGYKVDLTKIRETYGTRPEDPDNSRFLAIWEKFPLPFKYLGNGDEPHGHVALVLVLEDGYDKADLEGKEIPALGAPYDSVFTPGIWVSH
ncbi:uncharacterized protein EI90DRAFT_3159021 [Cantharellus anzutake]|uniref:uncharacterized protein n=1 Tax=Cantharellus anzutake TaxID=1750568 RepID=UPI0019041E26|nr:uncharacterized protein EI90DRAFT_3159021 [Cantharellus anzutake]KAF8315782.1 hypothetical protein EI90DRAFT_3159021 [Cantharellus anzutake]